MPWGWGALSLLSARSVLKGLALAGSPSAAAVGGAGEHGRMTKCVPAAGLTYAL